jgi:uncharacterized membrane protein YtjA (UPF0391 family)
MLKWALIFALISLVAAIFGFGGIVTAGADIAKILFLIFVALCVLFLALSVYNARNIR